ncbi:antibiotic biosynthesis monooxygenase [Desulfovibrio aminophilus]|uniref:antibiotic biosynthesis monooxygenase family protein n=1 Tax=Desulfovibrio aminophilus TaxID=81425 RepID=UPI0033989F9F
MSQGAGVPDPPYYAVVFTSLLSGVEEGYAEMAEELLRLASEQPGFLGAESAREADGTGITVSYWESLEAIENWRDHPRHQVAQAMGGKLWYEAFATRVCRVERHGRFKPPR